MFVKIMYTFLLFILLSYQQLSFSSTTSTCLIAEKINDFHSLLNRKGIRNSKIINDWTKKFSDFYTHCPTSSNSCKETINYIVNNVGDPERSELMNKVLKMGQKEIEDIGKISIRRKL